MKKILIGIALTAALFSYAEADTTSDAVAKAVAYLKIQGNDALKSMALVAAGETVDVSYLKSFSGATAIEYAKPIMAIVAGGENPSTYPTQDLLAKLKSFADGTQLGSASQVNDDIWGILALSSAGVQASDSVIQNSKAFILANQNTDGGWPWNTGGTSDTNDTAVAIMALLETGVAKSDSSIQKAIAYLKGAQNTDGGFPYDPVSPYGTDSDGNSDAWVIMAITKLGENPTSWTKDGLPAGEAGKNAVAHLLSLQDSDGGFWWMQPPADFNNKGPTADAVIALAGKSFPVVSSGGGDSGNSSVDPPPIGGGGGGGGGLGDGAGLSTASNGPGVPPAIQPQPQGEVLGEAVCSVEYLKEYIKLGAKNNPAEVKKLQEFLNINLGLNLSVTGFYGPVTFAAVNQFQTKYGEQVLRPWMPYGHPNAQTPTGYVYKTTKRWINMLNCPDLNLPIPPLP